MKKNQWDNLDITDRGHSKGNISQFCLFLGILGQIVTKLQPHRGQQQENVISFDLENLSQG